MTTWLLLLLASGSLLAQPAPPMGPRVQALDQYPGWVAVDSRITPLIGAVAESSLFQWPAPRVHDFLNLIVRSGGNLLLAPLPAPESAQPDPWLSLHNLLEWTAQRRIVLFLDSDGRPESLQDKARQMAAAFPHVLFAGAAKGAPVRASSVEAFWRALLSGAPRVALDLWTAETRNTLRAARMISSFTPIWEYTANDAVLLDRSVPAYAAARREESYLVYLPKGGSVSLAASEFPHAVVWICLDTAELEGHARPVAGGIIPLTAPDSRHWLALISR